MNDPHLPAPVQPTPNARARILLRKGLRGKDVAQDLTNSGMDEERAKSIVHTELKSFRKKAGLLLAAGLILALISLVASLRSYFELMRHTYGYRLFFFWPCPFLIGLVFFIVGITKLRKHRW